MKTWSSFYRDRHDSSSCLLKSLQPFYDRLVIKDTNGLGEIFLNEWCNRRFNQISVDFGNMVRATLLVSPIDMEKIKQWIISQCKKKNRSNPTNLSPSNLTCAFVWVCYMKAQARVDDKNFSHEDVLLVAWQGTGELLGEDGIIVAANQIGNKPGHRNWTCIRLILGGERLKKIEEISIDKMRGISFSESRFLKGGIEIGLALPKAKMDAFNFIFTQHLKFLQ
ncbi:hypothetical protein Patl1_17228 [Pistacia atlantica]|uniref:Uncharacterized protein n=1 Tax=Pistacia atlantica TaxID=434234 RepID=A0ACC1B5Q4_9ROSI|nr:hypothetical protein Patl1_17228 [Pistacia atlantica]